MALPIGVTSATITLSRPIGPDGSLGDLTDVTLSADRALIWTATGERIYGGSVPIPVSEQYGTVGFPVAHVDQSGFKDTAGNPIINWKYTLTYYERFGGQRGPLITKDFQVFVGTSTRDLDLAPDLGAISVAQVVIPDLFELLGLTEDADGLFFVPGLLAEDDDGLYLVPAGLTEDPAYAGLYLIGA